MSRWWPPNLWVLFAVVLLNYAAQVPYYLSDGQGGAGIPPSVSAIVLLGLTLVWFLVGFIATRLGRRFGYWLLLAFVSAEGLFYIQSAVFGAVRVAVSSPNPVVKVVFFIGFLSGVASLIFAFAFVRYRTHYQVPVGRGQ